MDSERAADALRAGCAEFLVPGAQLGLLRGDERMVVCAGTVAAGAAPPVEPTTAFHAGSIAKSLVALLVVDAARRGELDLDTPCDEQAAGLWNDTPRALMAQTTGRQNLLPEMDEELGSFVARVAQLPLTHPPGRFSYCNAGWSVLDLLLRRRCGRGFEELAADRVLGSEAIFGKPAGAAEGHGVGADGSVRPVPSDAAAAASAAGSRWWVTADGLLDYAALHLGDGLGRFDPVDVRELRRPHAEVPGSTMSDSWGLGWALWHRDRHRAFGWAGYTAGHRAYLRCFPEQDAAVVLLAGSAGPLFGPPGGSALFDSLLPEALELLGVPPIGPAARPATGRPAEELAGTYGPVSLQAAGSDRLLIHAAALGHAEPLGHHRIGGDTFARDGEPPGGMLVAVQEDLLYLGPFALPRL
jgi:CubicO group peptidase (beta-lactamase class C family)